MNSDRHPDPTFRRCQRLLLMVHELHKLGLPDNNSADIPQVRLSPNQFPLSWPIEEYFFGSK
ncbi:MAG: hypothetical protein ACFCU8_04045 [Thermosynechococcaceae cyanobacterium]